MKLLPFTLATQQLLIKDGYTHLVLKRLVEPEDREFDNGRQLIVYEAIADGDDSMRNYLTEPINSDNIKNLLRENEADCYVSIRN